MDRVFEDRRAAGRALVPALRQCGLTDPIILATIAEAYEDLGQREHALEWAGRAFRQGIESSRFEERPSLRGLVADERYRLLLNESAED